MPTGVLPINYCIQYTVRILARIGPPSTSNTNNRNEITVIEEMGDDYWSPLFLTCERRIADYCPHPSHLCYSPPAGGNRDISHNDISAFRGDRGT